jgi:hypothetical protein
MASPKELEQQVIKFAQLLLADSEDGTVDSGRIDEAIDQALAVKPAWAIGIDRNAVKDELIRRYSVWIGEDTTLKSEKGHIAWLTTDRKAGWRYWQRYREFLESGISEVALDGLDRSTDTILGLLEDPSRQDTFDRRGLVVGHVQSGKTASYTGLISKAADAGYKIVIVLAGLHNNLRSQTQVRLDEGFLGYETRANTSDVTPAGVGLIDSDPAIRPNYATNRSNSGDFNRAVARSLGISPEERPWLFVVKKNKSVLTLLLNWIRNRVANTKDTSTGRPLVTNLPLLVIDDEADHASVDTGENVVDENGIPDPEHEPKTINRLIRTVLHSFTHSAYVGYTATPFANIFIHERGETTEEGPDLFPSSFIINLAAPSSYVGPSKVFGVLQEDGSSNALPLSVSVLDFLDPESDEGWMPPKHNSDHVPLWQGQDLLPPSVRHAIHAFILSCAARVSRGQGSKHCSMLIHVTRFTAVQDRVWKQVEVYVSGIRQRLERNIDADDILRELQALWENDFLPKTAEVAVLLPDEVSVPAANWETILASLISVCGDISVRKINGTAKDVLDYADNEGTGLKVIAIGGDKLARGLTLEGLTTSYFLRASKMYDTLMQMGRWFGYRPGYLDLCRLYTTSELISWFGHIAEASEELRRDFDLMAQSGSTPMEYGLRVQSHPSLLVTSQVKMRAARSLMISFSGQVLETVTFRSDVTTVNRNFQTLQTLLAKLSGPEPEPVRERMGSKENWQGYVWSNVDSSSVVDFLSRYDTHTSATRVNTQLLSEFICKMNEVGELQNWTIALIGRKDAAARTPIVDGISIGMLVRQNNKVPGRYSIGRLLSPRDEGIDLSEIQWSAALELSRNAFKPDPARGRVNPPDSPNGPSIRFIRGFGSSDGTVAAAKNGLLLLYLLDRVGSNAPVAEGSSPIVAFGLSFPGSKAGTKVEYKVNNVLWEQEYGHSE